MITDICSAWAYDEIKKSGYVGDSQARYLFIFAREKKPLTHVQATILVEREFGIKLPERNGRLTELEKKGFLRQYDFVICEYTHKRVSRRIYTGRTEPLQITKCRACCPKCDGKGFVFQDVYYDGQSQMEFNF